MFEKSVDIRYINYLGVTQLTANPFLQRNSNTKTQAGQEEGCRK
jgi:hypothetical protein